MYYQGLMKAVMLQSFQWMLQMDQPGNRTVCTAEKDPWHTEKQITIFRGTVKIYYQR